MQHYMLLVLFVVTLVSSLCCICIGLFYTLYDFVCPYDSLQLCCAKLQFMLNFIFNEWFNAVGDLLIWTNECYLHFKAMHAVD